MKHRNYPIQGSTKKLLSTRHFCKGYTIGVKFDKSGKRLIPWIITGKGLGNTYTLSININYKDLIKKYDL